MKEDVAVLGGVGGSGDIADRVADADGTPDADTVPNADGVPDVVPAGRESAARVRRALPAGLVDAGLSSLSTFGVGLLATHLLSPQQLGAYAVAFAAFALAAAVPASLVFAPAEAAGMALERGGRSALLRHTMPMGALVAVLAAVVVCPAAAFIPSETPLRARLGFALTAMLLAAVSPLQDHVRRVFHQAGSSWQAVRMSLVQLVIVVGVMVGLLAAGVSRVLVPFTALAVANVVSLVHGLRRGERSTAASRQLGLRLRGVVRSGAWMTAGAVYGFFGALVAIAIVTVRSGATASGHAEAARVLSQPIAVVAVGIMSVLNPELMDAGRRRRSRHVHGLVAFYVGLITVLALAWAAIVSLRGGVSPLPRLFARAYEVHWLLAFMIVQQAVSYMTLSYRAALIGADRARTTAWMDVVAVTAGLAVTLLTTFSGPFAIVWGGVAGGVVHMVLGAVSTSRLDARHAARQQQSEPAPAPAAA